MRVRLAMLAGEFSFAWRPESRFGPGQSIFSTCVLFCK